MFYNNNHLKHDVAQWCGKYYPLLIKHICEVINDFLGIFKTIFEYYKLNPRTWRTLFLF
jgi:hypothetical protein